MNNRVVIGNVSYDGSVAADEPGMIFGNAAFQLVSLEPTVLDPTLASCLKEEATLPMPGQRAIDRKVVDEYRRLAGAGLWHISLIVIVEVMKKNGDPEMRDDRPDMPLAYLVNGNHTCQMVMESMTSINAAVAVFRATRETMQLLFSQLDNHKPRKASTAMAPIAITFGTRTVKQGAQKSLVTDSVMTLIARAIHWASEEGFSRQSKVPKNDRALFYIRDERDFVSWLVSINHDPERPFAKDTEGGSETWLWKLGVVAAMYKTWKTDSKAASLFWTRVIRPKADGDVPETLRSLLKAYANGKEWGKRGQGRVARVCSDFWNAWVTGENKSMSPSEVFQAVAAMDDKQLDVVYFADGVDPISTKVDAPTGDGECVIRESKIDARNDTSEERQSEEEHHLTI